MTNYTALAQEMLLALDKNRCQPPHEELSQTMRGEMAVLRLLAGVINVGGFHPNFLIATYCLAILLIRPSFVESVIIGVLSGVISQIGTSMAWIGIVSETVGAVAMFLLVLIPLKAGKFDLRPIVCTLLTTLVTAALNCVIVQILVLPLRKILNK